MCVDLFRSGRLVTIPGVVLRTVNSTGSCLHRIVRGVNSHTSRYRPKGGLVNDASLISTPARYFLQIASKGEWKTVAYLNDPEEARRTLEKVPDLRVFDTWKNAEVRLRDLPKVHREQDLLGRWVKRIS